VTNECIFLALVAVVPHQSPIHSSRLSILRNRHLKQLVTMPLVGQQPKERIPHHLLLVGWENEYLE